MKINFKNLTIALAVFCCFTKTSNAQNAKLNALKSYVFTSDSISGFDEQVAKSNALQFGLYGEEFKVFMYKQKRSFIKEKYNLQTVYTKQISTITPLSSANKTSAMPSSGACNNEDFEDNASSPGPQIGGVMEHHWFYFEP